MSNSSSRQEIRLSRPEDLEGLRRALRSGGATSVRLVLPLGTAESRRAWLERRINRSLAACGCSEGTVVGLLYLFLVPTVVMGGYVPHSVINWLIAIGGFIVALIIGKFFGLLLARVRLFLACREIQLLARQRAME